MTKKIYITSDHAGFELKNKLIESLKEIAFVDLNPKFDSGDDYPVFAKDLAEKLKNEPASLGIALCGTGQGISMALNRFPWIRAGIGYDPEIVKLIRAHNQANVLCLPGRFLTLEKAQELINIFLSTNLDMSERHLRRLRMFGE